MAILCIATFDHGTCIDMNVTTGINDTSMTPQVGPFKKWFGMLQKYKETTEMFLRNLKQQKRV